MEGQGGGDHRDHDRQEDQLGGVGDRDRQVQGEHAHEVHAPDPDAHRDGAACDPRRALTAVGERDAAGEIEGGIRRQDRDQDRKDDDQGAIPSLEYYGRLPHRLGPSKGWVGLSWLTGN
jgi:hypothetical protein